jgi:hypothetical protein
MAKKDNQKESPRESTPEEQPKREVYVAISAISHDKIIYRIGDELPRLSIKTRDALLSTTAIKLKEL